MSDQFTCPHCGAEVPFDANVCPECGSDEHTGWSETAECAHLLPYDEEEDVADSVSGGWGRSLLAIAAVVALLVFLASKFTWGMYAVALLLLVGAAYGIRQLFRRTRYGVQRRLYWVLLQRARGDEQLVERLIEYERQRSPDLDRTQWLQDAIDRWERDFR